MLLLLLRPAAAQEVKNGEPESVVETFTKTMKIRSVNIVPNKKNIPEISYSDLRKELDDRGLDRLLQARYSQPSIDQAAVVVREMYKSRYSLDVEVMSWAKRINPRFVRLEFRVKLASN